MERRRGGQPGNQNARKHGFYSKALGEAQRLEFRQATRVKGLDAEIALLRVKIKALLSQDPQNILLLGQEVKILSSLLIAGHNMSKDEKDDLGEIVHNALADFGFPFLPLGYAPEQNESSVH